MNPEGYTIVQRGRVVISPEEAMARESVGERVSTADRWHGLDTSLVRSGDRLEENKGQWVHMRRNQTFEPLSDDDMCEHGYVRDHAPHPAAGLERCPVCDSYPASEQ